MANPATDDLDRLMRGLLAYQRTRAKLTWQEVLEKKGRDLGIKLYEATKARQWGAGNGAGIAEAEMRRRAREGRGTKLRKSIRDAYDAKARGARIGALRLLGGSHLNAVSTRGMSAEARRQVAAVKRAESRRFNGQLWREYVGKEIGARQRGIGVLAVGWLWYRRRSSQSRGTYFVRNKTGRKLGWVHIGENTLRMVNVQEGIGIVTERYGIMRQAVNAVLRDMDVYMARKQGRAVGLALLEQGLPTTVSAT